MRCTGKMCIRDRVKQRLMALGEVTGFRKPVIHLDIDVSRPVGTPRRPDLVIPDALEIGRLRTLSRTGDQQIASELKVEGE